MTDDNCMNMQRKLKLFRQIFGMGITSFADMIGVTRQTVYNLENAKTVLSKTQYLAICHVLKSLLNRNPQKYAMAKSVWETEYNVSFETAFEEPDDHRLGR